MWDWLAVLYETNKGLFWFAGFFLFGWTFGWMTRDGVLDGLIMGVIGLALIVDMHRNQVWQAPPTAKD